MGDGVYLHYKNVKDPVTIVGTTFWFQQNVPYRLTGTTKRKTMQWGDEITIGKRDPQSGYKLKMKGEEFYITKEGLHKALVHQKRGKFTVSMRPKLKRAVTVEFLK